MRPRVSVIIPVRNQAPRLHLTLAALSRQSGVGAGDHEIVIVDDGSTDGIASTVDALRGRFTSLQVVGTRSRGARGVPRNVGAQVAQGELLVFLDADACPGDRLLAGHLQAQAEGRAVVLGDIFVVPGTETLLDPRVGRPFPAFENGSVVERALRVTEEDWDESAGVETFFAPYAEKGGYPGLAQWHAQLEELLVTPTSVLAWMGGIPHNLSVRRADFVRWGGFDPFLPHSEGWDLGLRARRAGCPVRFASGAKSFHLYHWRAGGDDSANVREAREILCARHPLEVPQAGYVWCAAMNADDHVPPEMSLNDWQVVEEMVRQPIGRRQLVRIYENLTRAEAPWKSLDYLTTRALNAPMVSSR